MIKKITYSILIFLHSTAIAFAWHRPGHKDGEDKPGNPVPEIDGSEIFLIIAFLICAGLLYYHWRRSRDIKTDTKTDE